jgi:alpha-glucosidase
VPAERIVDPDGRDGCRAPIPWTADGDDEVGHGWPSRPWLPFPANASTHAADKQVGRPDSMYTLYRDLLALRRELAVLRRGSIEFAPLEAEVIRYERVLDDERIVVLVGVGDAAAPWPDDLVDAEVLISSDPTRTQTGEPLAPAEAVVLRVAAAHAT